jgi:hypothetical protein
MTASNPEKNGNRRVQVWHGIAAGHATESFTAGASRPRDRDQTSPSSHFFTESGEM